MRLAFVGVKRKYQELPPDYRYRFDRFHLELPFYFAHDGQNDVTITTVDYLSVWQHLEGGGSLRHEPEGDFARNKALQDVVVHWRKWYPELYRPEARNVLLCQDHSFSGQWLADVGAALASKKLEAVLCFPGWHCRNLLREVPSLREEQAVAGLTLGVDTDVFFPVEDKDPYRMLWAADPGRGLLRAVQLAVELHRRDSRFHLTVCWPDYIKSCTFQPQHPAIDVRGNVPNGPRLWSLFNASGILPYTSNFREPSSRCHRQMQAAGGLVLYPPDMGTPSELIESGRTGIVAPVEEWADLIQDHVESGRWREVGRHARELAVSENWAVQATRFNRYFGGDQGR